ncbi:MULTISPECIES: MFS transporter [Streptococcus]|uniref:MFS transporter n=1 Tax=Streptococcus TaxID=1301 RepID=UPI0003F64351|nr:MULTISPECIES: MFS transporter [Streptococcus]MBY5025932.1 MFS transporter [Streptococcus suis]QZT16457.1 MFS transporter [Streptococcus suis]HEM3181885.1 MFS transporter [Streptococcus suis 89-5259]
MNKTVDSNPSDKLHLGKFLAWKGRDVSSSAVQVIVLGYLMLFATDTLHLSPAFVGGLLMISKIINAITNLFAGFLVDNTNTKLGKGRPYEIAIIGVWICTVLLFSCPPEWSTTVKSIWIVIMYFFIFSVFNSLLTAAQTPYMIRAFPSRNQVIKVSSYGGVISMLGAMIVSITFPMMMGKLATSGAGWNKLILIYAIPLCIIGILRFIFVKEDTSIYAGASSEKIKIKDVVTMFKANKFLWFYAGMIGLFNIIQGMAVQAQYFKYVVGNISLQGIMGFLTILMLPIMFFFPKLMKKLSVSQLIQYSAIISGVGYLINFFAKDSIPLLIVGSLLSGLAVLPLSYLGNVIIMNLAGYNEQIGLQRMEGSTNVSVGFVGAVFNGIGTGLVGLLLGISGYIGSANVQSESALFMIRSIYALIPLACMFGIYLFSKKLADLEKVVK